MVRATNHISPRGLTATVRHYLGDMVYGANDGLITTFAAVAAVEGGRLSATAVLVVGIANLLADGLSMGIGNYLAIQAREQTRAAEDLPEEESEPIRHVHVDCHDNSAANHIGPDTALAITFAGGSHTCPRQWCRPCRTRM